MRNITLKWVKDRKACGDAVISFIRKFGEEATTEQVLYWLSTIHRPDWLAWVMSRDDVDIIRELLDHGADVHAYNDYALRWAAGRGHTDVVRLLVEHGADIHANNNCALRCAAESGHADVVEFLRQAAA